MTLGRVFVDTGAWFALQVEDDEHYEAARITFPALLKACRSVVTSNLIVGETYTLLRTTKGYREAKGFLNKLTQSAKLERFFVTQAVERQAYELLHRYAEHPFSLLMPPVSLSCGSSGCVMRLPSPATLQLRVFYGYQMACDYR